MNPILALLAVLILPAAAQTSPAAPALGSAGVLVMAHGGDAAWDRAVREAVAPLASAAPTELAFGMADAETLQDAVTRLEARGVRRIAVVRLFVSGDSFLERTKKILGLLPGAGPRPAAHAQPAGGHAHHGHGGRGGGHGRFHDPDLMPLWAVETRSRIVISEAGLMDGEQAGAILAERAAALSQDAARESVLVLGHGPGDDAENARWLEKMRRAAEKIRAAKPFADVRVETLREDWPEKRREAEERIRRYAAERAASGRLIVVPFRVFGFGPYAEVLKGLRYASDGRGLLPHPRIGEWLRESARAEFEKAGWTDAAASVAATGTPASAPGRASKGKR